MEGKSKITSMTLLVWMVQALDRVAEEETEARRVRVSRSALVRQIVEDFLNDRNTSNESEVAHG